MKTRDLLIFLFCAGIVITACEEKEDPCVNEVIITRSLEELYGCTNTMHDMEIDLVDDYVIISSQSVFDHLIAGTCQPEIDFSNFDLIIGKQSSTTITHIDYKYTWLCNEDVFQLEVKMYHPVYHNDILNQVGNLTSYTYHALVPKLEANAVVEVKIRSILDIDIW